MDGSTPTAVDHYEAMVAGRQQFLASWLMWVSKASPSAVDEERKSFIRAIDQIADLYATQDDSHG
jgi:hypothetical protein